MCSWVYIAWKFSLAPSKVSKEGYELTNKTSFSSKLAVLYLCRFIPGTSANGVHYQAYLIDGITRWNRAHADASIDCPGLNLRTFDMRLQNKVQVYPWTTYMCKTFTFPPQINELSEDVHGTKVFPLFQPPSTYTGELFGVEYLFAQSGQTPQRMKILMQWQMKASWMVTWVMTWGISSSLPQMQKI